MNRVLANIFGSITAGIMGAAGFLVFFLLLSGWDMPLRIIIPIGIGILAYIAGVFLFPGKVKSSAETAEETIKNLLTDAVKKIKELRAFELEIKKESLKSDIEVICITFEDILDEYKKEPMDISAFINYYLDSAIKIVKKYVELSEMSIKTPEIENLMQKSENIIQTLRDALIKQMENTMQNDLIDLDSEIEVLQKTLKSEGL